MRAGRLLTWRPVLVAVALVAWAGVVGGWAAAARAAEYKTPRLVSYEGVDQAQAASQPALAASGEFVAFSGTFDGVSGVWRKDLGSGAVALVAGTDEADPALSAPDAGAPSISADGRYVAFTTTAPLDPADDPGGGCASVYVRDMAAPIGAPGAYVLASALNGSAAGLTYAGSGAAGCPGGGSAAAARVALSGDGRYVAFTVIGESNLTTGAGGPPTTPPFQVAVRDLATDTTTLVSQTLESLGGVPQPVPGGAAYGSADAARGQIGDSTAAISADGTTVAWMGVDIPAQAPASSAPIPQGEGPSTIYPPNSYAEPLWRRVAAGPAAPPRRVTGGDDPLCGCPGPLATGFNLGSTEPDPTGLVFGTFIADSVNSSSAAVLYPNVTPQLSADGDTVAFLATAPLTGQVAQIRAEHTLSGFTLRANAYVVDMAPGLSRTAALTQLTTWASANGEDFAADGDVSDIALSPDGEEVAFVTQRTEFPLAPPALVTPALQAGVKAQLYVADLSAGTLSQASHGYDGLPANGAIAEPSFAGAGGDLAFASGATNLVYGAFNRAGSDVFLVEPDAAPAVPGTSRIGAAPVPATVKPRWQLLLSAHRRSDGSVVVVATVPGAGGLAARARAAVPVKGGPVKNGAAGRRPRSGRVATRTVGSARRRAKAAGTVRLVLRGRRAFRHLVRDGGLFATITVRFHAAGHGTLTGKVQAIFARGKKGREKK